MKHHPLADLAAQPHPSLGSDATTTIRPRKEPFTQDVPSSSHSNLSPRRRFKAHVRGLSKSGSGNDKNRPESHANHDPAAGLQHVPSLRTQALGTPSPCSSPGVETRNIIGNTSPARADDDEAHVMFEEQRGWRRSSPVRQPAFEHYSRGDEIYRLEPSEDTPASERGGHPVPLKTFGPSSIVVDINDRPKTSRGHASSTGADAVHTSEQSGSPKRPSRFAEGSMNERSAALSSAWVGDGSAVNSGANLGRAAINSDTFIPPHPATSSALKQQLHRLGTAFRHHDQSMNAEPDALPVKKKGLRKSISTWGLRAFGASTADLTPRSPVRDKKTGATTSDQGLELLADRKRRAEEAYAQQFGTKRRKSNVGVAAPAESSAPPAPKSGQAKKLQKSEPASQPTKSALKKSASTTALAGRRLSRRVPAAALTDTDESDGVDKGDIDRMKRRSRRELEKENQQLRQLLMQRENESMRPPSMHLPKAVPSQIPIFAEPASHNKSASGSKISPTRAADIPPVPSLPDREVLKNLTAKSHSSRMNTTANSNANSKVLSHTAQELNLNIGPPRPVSMILEMDEGDPNAKGDPEKQLCLRLSKDNMMKENMAVPSPVRPPAKREHWEWPEDVF